MIIQVLLSRMVWKMLRYVILVPTVATNYFVVQEYLLLFRWHSSVRIGSDESTGNSFWLLRANMSGVDGVKLTSSFNVQSEGEAWWNEDARKAFICGIYRLYSTNR